MFAVLALALLATVVAAAGDESRYTSKYDKVDVDTILGNNRLLNTYFNCLMGKMKCSPDGQELKDRIPEALENECQKCSDQQRAGAEKVLKFIYEKKQDMFKQLEAKYDPQGKYRLKYKKRAEAAGYKV